MLNRKFFKQWGDESRTLHIKSRRSRVYNQFRRNCISSLRKQWIKNRLAKASLFFGPLEGIRTPVLQNRNLLRYPASLRAEIYLSMSFGCSHPTGYSAFTLLSTALGGDRHLRVLETPQPLCFAFRLFRRTPVLQNRNLLLNLLRYERKYIYLCHSGVLTHFKRFIIVALLRMTKQIFLISF